MKQFFKLTVLVLMILFSSRMNVLAQVNNVNIALGSSVTWSDDNGAGTGGDLAVDGITNVATSRWVSNASNSEHSLEIDFKASFPINSVKLFYELTGNAGHEHQVKFRLEAWISEQWVPIFEENDAPNSSYLTASGANGTYLRTFDAVTTNKVRYVVPAWSSTDPGATTTYTNNRVRLFEIEVYSENTNIALGKTVTANHAQSGFPASNTVDNNKTTRWLTDASNNEEHYLDIDLVDRYAINLISIYRDQTFNSTERNQTFDIQIWDENANAGTGAWITLLSKVDFGLGVNRHDIYTATFNEVITSKIRYHVPAYTINRVRLFEIEVYGRPAPVAPKELHWTSTSSTTWNTPANWSIDNGGTLTASTTAPTDIDIVYIPGDATVFPELTGNAADNICAEIHFGAGAEIGNQQLLTYNKAFIQYDFSEDGLVRGQWHTLSNPLQEVYSGDFTFGGYPRTYVRKFVSDNFYGGWVDVPGNDTKFTAGQGFAYFVKNEDFLEKGLGFAGGIIDLPYFERTDTDISLIHPAHEYNSVTHESTFFYYDKIGDEYVVSTDGVVVTRTADAYKLADATVTETLQFTEDPTYGSSPFALAGNPFMTTINFDELQEDNSTVIAPTYLVWTKVGDDAAGFAGYNASAGNFGLINSFTGLDEFIAPQQSFIVVKAIEEEEEIEEKAITEGETASLTFDINAVSATGESSTLRSAQNTNNKLDIIAHNATADVLTFVANREGGQSTLNNKDSRKLLAGLSDVPEIYTLKPDGNTQVAVGANIIGDEDIVIPLAIATTYNGKLTLTFKGMDNYNTGITLIDRADNNKEYLLTGASFEKEFDFVPEKNINNEVIPTENRFLLQFSKPTGLNQVSTGQISVYSRNKEIQVVSSSYDLIKQIAVYNAQGQTVYVNNQVNAPAYTLSSLKNTAGVYIVKVITAKGSKNIKIK
jgi:hypothetical protein